MLRFLAVVAGYALSYSLFRSVSFSHWIPLAGLRLVWLMFLPYRYWPAVVLGEVLPLAYTSIQCLELYGTAWAAFNMLPPVMVVMPVVHWFRQRQPFLDRKQIDGKQSVDIGAFLQCSLIVSIIWSGVFLLSVGLMHAPPGETPSVTSNLASRYLLGNFLGILAIAPLALMAWETLGTARPHTLLQQLSTSRLAMEFVFLTVPVIALLTWLGADAAGDARQVARIAMFIPVAALALRHGWHGAALGGFVASVGIILTMVAKRDPSVIQAQALMALAITSFLLLGSRIAAQNKREQASQIDSKRALEIAQQGFFLSEMRLRQASFALDHIGASVQEAHNQLLGQLRYLLPAVDSRNHYRQATANQQRIYRLADSMYPLAWRDRGLPAALRAGSIARTLDEIGISYQCEILGRGLSSMSPRLHAALYRAACEAVVYLVTQAHPNKVRMTIRGCESQNRRWVVLQVDGVDAHYAATNPATSIEWEWLAPRLGASGLGLDTIRDIALIYAGTLRVRSTEKRVKISLFLQDADSAD
ncbi:MASE1 domain-containing protein [Dyella tabacisoli]|uniref:MASE1 domain-containing protein n=1 Tax=Dyella tabacisoli TaxID=2282381 RepID=UPI0013B3AEB7|nr:MASE1 domain-containing protein [Dyella tabacisoli]